ncbi:hypothetical protein ACOMHN_019398 [Nucella lapillus]
MAAIGESEANSLAVCASNLTEEGGKPNYCHASTRSVCLAWQDWRQGKKSPRHPDKAMTLRKGDNVTA